MDSTFFNNLSKKPDLWHLLFRRGWIISKAPLMFPYQFLDSWKTKLVSGWYFYCHPDSNYFIYNCGNRIYFLMGHAYNPFTMEHREESILKHLSETSSDKNLLNRINELTGVFTIGWLEDNKITFLTDPSGMQSCYYGSVDNNFMITSHTQIIADLYQLPLSDIVKELINYKWYNRVMGAYLPADLSPHDKIKRAVPNIIYNFDNLKISHRRFYPLENINQVKNEAEYNQVIEDAANILKNGAALVLKKWPNPAISLTGGIDSNTTFAAANGLYSNFRAFSYLSAEKEVPDVEAAKIISSRFNIEFEIFNIPDSNQEIKDFDIKKNIIIHNNGYIAVSYDNEIRKRIFLEQFSNINIEVKSWVSETIRAYWYKHYGRNTMPKLTPKLFRNLYKIFITNRKLAHKIDKIFEKYIEEFEYNKIPSQYPPADMHYNEVTWGSWGGLNISEMKYCFDITFLYNNRIFLDLLFRIPLEDRISDKHHLEMKKYLNKELYDMNIRVVNLKETKTRARLLNLIFTANMLLPF